MDNTLNRHITRVLKAFNLHKMSTAYLSLECFKLGRSLTEEEKETLISNLEEVKKGIFKGDEEVVDPIINKIRGRKK